MTNVDRRFGINKFGGQKFGASTSDSDLLAWGVEIDWNGDGLFDGTSEARKMTGINIFRGRRNWLKPAGDGFESLKTGNASLTLSNSDGKYDGWNTSSPLYPNVSSGKDLRIRVRDRLTNIIYNVFYGVVANIAPVNYGRDPMTTVSADDGWRFLRDYSGSVAVQTSISPDMAIGAILDNVRWPERWGRLLASTSDVISFWWADGNSSAGSELADIADSFLHNFFIDAQGRARLISRSETVSAVKNYYQEQLAKDIRNPQPQENNRTMVRLKVHPRSLAASGVIYSYLGNALSLAPGATLVLFVDYSYAGNPCPATNVITPVANTDWATNTAADGSGTNKTAYATMSYSDFGATGKYTIKNNDAGTVYVAPLKVRGQAVFESDAAALTYPSNPATLANPRQFVLDLKWQQDINAARDFTDVLGAFLTALHPFPVISIINRPALQFGVDLFDIVSLTIPYLGIDGVAFKVGGIEHRSQSNNCQAIVTTLYLEPYISAANFMAWDTASVWDTSTIFGY